MTKTLKERYEKKILRARGVEELYEIVDGVRYVLDRYSQLKFWRKWYFKKQLRKELICYEKDLEHLYVENQLEAYNSTLEKTIEKYGGIK